MARKLAVISFTKRGLDFQNSIKPVIDGWAAMMDFETAWYCHNDACLKCDGYIHVTTPTKEWAANRFEDSDVIIYISTVTKAVRTTAPSITEHVHDPAVMAIDVQGRYSVTLLPGKSGEAYDLSHWLQDQLHIISVNENTDLERFSIEQFAKDNDMVISNISYARGINAAIDAGDQVGFFTKFPVKGELPMGYEWSQRGAIGVMISPSYQNAYYEHTLWLIPKCITVGMEIKNPDISPRDIEIFAGRMLRQYNIYPEAVKQIAVTQKDAQNDSLKIFCSNRDWPYVACEEDELNDMRKMLNYSDDTSNSSLLAIRFGEGNLVVENEDNDDISVSIALKKVYINF